MNYQTIAQIRDSSVARILVVALRAHGFHPLDPRDGGLPGVRPMFGTEGIRIDVPENEAEDATILLEDLLKDMEGASPAKPPY
ncbi:MAG: hypothetical protein KIS86_18625 [Devosia sp.]|nr:hypothetical protein [Devosia sp.]